MNSLNLVSPFLEYAHDGIILIAGALIGFLSSSAMWRRQVAYERKKKRAEYILRAIQLSAETLTHTRCLAYSHTQGITGALSLPNNPVDELVALADFLPEIKPLIQKLHNKQQDLFDYNIHSTNAENAVSEISKMVDDMVLYVNETMNCLRKSMNSNK